jgi:DNA-binding MarR family transcriptional regulator
MTVAVDPAVAAQLRLVVMRLSRRLRQRAGTGVTPSQLSALVTVDRAGPLALRDLAALEDIAPSSLTRIVNALEEQGLLQRTLEPTDRRVSLVALTGKARRLLGDVRRRSAAYLEQRLAALTADEQATLVAALPALEMLLEDDG